MPVRLLDTTEELTQIADDWRRLAGGHPMRGYDWQATWAKHYLDAGGVAVLAVTDSEHRTIGIAPWRLERSVRCGAALRWLGDGEVCTDHPSLLCQPGREQQVIDNVADFLTDDFEDWDALRLDDNDADDATLQRLTDALSERGCDVASRDAGSCWSVELPGDWEAFLAMQSKSHRKQLRRAERRVLDSDSCRWNPVFSADQLEHAWEVLVDLHRRRRQSLGEPGCFASAKFAAFHRELAQRLLDAGQLRLSWLDLDGTPAAAELHFAGAGAVFAYQGGVDPDRLDDEPGRLSNIATIKAAIDEGATSFDFLRGDEPYKAHWRAQPRPTYHLQIVPHRRSAQLRAHANRALGAFGSSLKALRKSP